MNKEEKDISRHSTLPCSFNWTSLLPTTICNQMKASQSETYYENLLKLAANYEEWCEAASMLDEIQGLDKWRVKLESPDYDWELIKTRLDQLREIRKSNKGQLAMIFALRTSLARNLGDMGNPKLYACSRVGTKDLTSDYIEEVVKQLNWICDEEDPENDPHLDLKAKHDFFMNIRQSFGRTALLLSGGGTLGLNHMGVIKCLHEAQLLPRIISGASSGSIMAALVCTKTNDEMPYMFDASIVRLDVFERQGKRDLPYTRLLRLMKQGQLFDVEILKEAMRANLGDITFQEAFNRTRFILNITVSSSTLYDMPRLLNYLTAPDVLIWSAVAASCSVPVFYGSTPLYSKDKHGNIATWNPNEDQLYIDGSVENDLPMNKLSELFNVNHFIVCQVNPHVIPFLQKTITPSRFRQVANFCMHMAKTEAQHRCTQLTELGVMPSFFYKMQSIMSQKYSGDITIIPEIGYADFLKVLSNPTPDYVMDCIQRGERATWPKMPIIKNHLQIELTIDKILYRLRLRRLSELQRQQSLFLTPTYAAKRRAHRPVLESRSISQLNMRHSAGFMSPIDEQEYDDESATFCRKRTEMLNDADSDDAIFVQSSQSTPMFIALSDQLSESKESRMRKSTKRGLLMTKPE
ncbi:MAG: acyl transferase/acyl hydrolase/lysophospholipase [Benjaminiella poitrasii]|nr:MAG: acyl transferase/acyl hydrolase/lysophospholipase [Benjaminiella poitrasii]